MNAENSCWKLLLLLHLIDKETSWVFLLACFNMTGYYLGNFLFNRISCKLGDACGLRSWGDIEVEATILLWDSQWFSIVFFTQHFNLKFLQSWLFGRLWTLHFKVTRRKEEQIEALSIVCTFFQIPVEKIGY